MYRLCSTCSHKLIHDEFAIAIRHTPEGCGVIWASNALVHTRKHGLGTDVMCNAPALDHCIEEQHKLFCDWPGQSHATRERSLKHRVSIVHDPGLVLVCAVDVVAKALAANNVHVVLCDCSLVVVVVVLLLLLHGTADCALPE